MSIRPTRLNDKPMRRYSAPLYLLLLLFLFNGCAYFNTMFNAKKNYNDGIKELEKNASAGENRDANLNSVKKYFETTIEKCWKLLEIYGDQNSYSDDALLLIGKSEFNLQKYGLAKQHLDKFIRKYPDSELLAEAQLFYAKALLREGKIDEANELFRQVLNSARDGATRSQANLEIGQYAFEQKQYEEAVAYLQEALKEDIKDEDRARLQYNLGESYFIQKKYKEALKQYEGVGKHSPSVAIEYQALLQTARTQSRLGEYNKAARLLRKMLTAPRFQSYVPVIKNELGENYQRQGQTDEATDIYREVVRERRTSPGSAQAAVNLARLFEFTYNDIDSAVTYYRKVRSLYSRYDSLETVEDKSKFLGEFKEIRDKIRYERKLVYRLTNEKSFRDSLYNAQREDSVNIALGLRPGGILDSLQDIEDVQEFQDSLQRANGTVTDPLTEAPGQNRSGVDPASEDNSGQNQDQVAANDTEQDQQSQDDPFNRSDDEQRSDGNTRSGEENNARINSSQGKTSGKSVKPPLEKRKLPEIEFDFMRNRFELAEFYLLKVENYDSAKAHYTSFLQTYDDSVLTPKAIYSLIFINRLPDYQNPQQVDSLEDVMIKEYPGSIFSHDILVARGVLSDKPPQNAEERAQKLYREAEKTYFSGDTRQAFRSYRSIAQLDSTLETAAKAQYALAWIYEYDFAQRDSALQAYKMLIERYPQATEYVQMARAKTTPIAERATPTLADAQTGAEANSNDGIDNPENETDIFDLSGENILEEKILWRKRRLNTGSR